MPPEKRRVLGESPGASLDESLAVIKDIFHAPRNTGLSVREFNLIRGNRRIRAAVLFLNDIVDTGVIENTILKPLLRAGDASMACDTRDVITQCVPGARVRRGLTYSDIAGGLVAGSSVLLVDGEAGCLIWETRFVEHRAVEESPAEAIVRGPHAGFVEDESTNIGLLRLYLATPDLVTERVRVGARSNTPFTVAYLDGVADCGLVQEVLRRLRSVKADFIPSVDILEPYIEDQPNSPLPTILVTERPDRVAGMLAEGHVAIISPSPGVAVVPATIWDLMQSPEDHHVHYMPASAMRLTRWLAVFTTVYSSALYVAVTNYHPEMIPTELLSAIASAREAVPFPAALEVLAMEVALELIREASARIPATFGPTVGIVGAVVLGQAAVLANIVNPILVVVVAVSGLGAFAIPNYELAVALRLVKFAMIGVASIAGIPSLTALSVLLVARLCVHRSFGVPVTAPVVPHRRHSPDIILRGPAWAMEERPGHTRPADPGRQPGRPGSRGTGAGRRKGRP